MKTRNSRHIENVYSEIFHIDYPNEPTKKRIKAPQGKEMSPGFMFTGFT